MLFFGQQIGRQGWAQMYPQTSEAARPYVIFATSQLLVSDDAQPVRVVFEIKNSGQSQAEGSLKDLTYFFSVNPEQLEFAYRKAAPMKFSLAPGEVLQSYFSPNFVLTREKLQALTTGAARLFFYARGEYRNGNGTTTYPLTFARIYNPTIPSLLAMPPDNVIFK